MLASGQNIKGRKSVETKVSWFIAMHVQFLHSQIAAKIMPWAASYKVGTTIEEKMINEQKRSRSYVKFCTQFFQLKP